MFEIVKIIFVFLVGVVVGILFGRANPKKSQAVYDAATKVKDEINRKVKKN